MPATDPNETRLRLRVLYLDPPDPNAQQARFGLQDRDGSLHEGRPQRGGDVRYDFEIAARWDPGQQRLRLRGPWVQGTSGAPFFYISWRRVDPEAQPTGWIRRTKIWLTMITLSQVERARRNPGSALLLRVPGRAPDGGPMGGGVRLEETEWSLVEAPDFDPIAPP